MPDTNMETVYSWASHLADVSQLQISTDNITKVTELVIEINNVLGSYMEKDKNSGGTGLFENFPDMKEIILNHVDDKCRHSEFDQKNEEHRKSFGCRLWSGCLSAAKTIALETMDGPNTPEFRTITFRYLENRANNDPIYRLGIESAPLFKKFHQQCYSFNGVPSTSAVRKYPNEYLIDKNGTDGSLVGTGHSYSSVIVPKPDLDNK